MQPTTESRHPSQRSRPSVFSLYIIRYNRNGHGCRPRISGGGRIIQKDGGGCRARITGHGCPSSGGCILKDGGHGCPTSARGTGSGHATRGTAGGSMGANGGKVYPKRGQNGQKRDEKGLFGASEGVSRGIFAGRPGGACRHAPRSVAAALACESGVFEGLPRLIIS